MDFQEPLFEALESKKVPSYLTAKRGSQEIPHIFSHEEKSLTTVCALFVSSSTIEFKKSR